MKIGIIGLGYVGLPLAVEFSKQFKVVGFDINKNRIRELNSGVDNTKEVESDIILSSFKNLKLTFEKTDLKTVNIFIVTVPTPINADKTPDLVPLKKASETVSEFLKKGDCVVYESTVYPGATEEYCVPILEKKSGLKFNIDFTVGYSPERINPGDKIHTLTKIKKVVSGSNSETTRFLSKMYNSIIEAGIYEAESIKIAEAAKVIENTQRDVNIAFINELSIIFNKLNINTNQVLNAAGTKWNFLNFKPGIVGGHCIGVDPYYLSYKAKQIGYHPEIILAGRKINDNMPTHIVQTIIKVGLKKFKNIKGKNALILGATFKENCPDLRNSRVYEIYKELTEYQIDTKIFDPIANEEELKGIYANDVIQNINQKYDILIIAVSHLVFKDLNIKSLTHDKNIVFDIKSLFPNEKGFLRL